MNKNNPNTKHIPKIYGDGYHNNLQYIMIEFLEYSVEEYIALPEFVGKLTLI
jgi:hypothetical protein